MAYERVIHIGFNRGKARVYIQNKNLTTYGFHPGARFNVSIAPSQLTLTIAENGTNKVSGKGDTPIIDLCTDELLTVSKNEVLMVVEQGTVTLSRKRAANNKKTA